MSWRAVNGREHRDVCWLGFGNEFELRIVC